MPDKKTTKKTPAQPPQSKSGTWTIYLDSNNQITGFDLSDEFYTLIGWNKENFRLDLNFWLLAIHFKDRAAVRNAVKEIYYDTTSRKTFEVDFHVKGQDEKYRYLHATGRKFINPDKTSTLLGVCINAADKPAKEAIADEKTDNYERLSLLNALIHSGMWTGLYDRKTKNITVTWSDEFRKMLGYTSITDFPDTFEAWAERIHPADKERVLQNAQEIFENPDDLIHYDDEYRLKTKSGEYRWFHAVGKNRINTKGDPEIIGIFTDTTAEHEKQQQLDIIRALAKNFTTALTCTLSTGEFKRVVFSGAGANEASEFFKEHPNANFTDDVFIRRFVHPQDRENYIKIINPTYWRSELAKKREFTFTYRHLINGKFQYIRLTICKTEEADEIPEHIIIGLENVDEEYRKAIQETAMNNQAASFANYFLENFTAAFYFDLNNRSLIPYRLPKYLEGKATPNKGYHTLFMEYMDSIVLEEDRAELLTVIDPANIRKKLKDSSTFTHTYRIKIGNQIRYIIARVIRGADEDHAAVGYLDITDAYLRDEREKERLQNQELINIIGTKLETAWTVNLATGAVKLLADNGFISGLIPVDVKAAVTNEDVDTILKKYYGDFIHPEDRPKLLNALSTSFIRVRLSHSKRFNLIFRCIKENGAVIYYNLIIGKKEEQDEQPKQIVIGLEIVDNQIRTLMDREKELSESHELINALSNDYEFVILLDLEKKKDSLLRVPAFVPDELPEWAEASDFHERIHLFMDKFLSPSDKDYVLSILTEEKLASILKSKTPFSLQYKLFVKGKPEYWHTKITVVDDVHPRLIIGSRNVDEETKRNMKNVAVMANLTKDYAYVSYIAFGATAEEDNVKVYRESERFSELIPDWDIPVSFNKRIELIQNALVLQQDRALFAKITEREVVISALKQIGMYHANFRVELDGKISNYQIKFAADYNKKGEVIGAVAGLHNIDDEIQREIEERHNVEELVEKRTLELNEKNTTLKRMGEGVLELIGDIVESRSKESATHIKHVKGYVYILAKKLMEMYPELGLNEAKVMMITYTSPLHDLGKIAIPDSILLKPGTLSPEEFEIMKTHCERGAALISNLSTFWSDEYVETAKDICMSHHEKWNGTGYPRGLKGDEIPLAAQIVSVADVYDALISKRCYKDSVSCDSAYSLIAAEFRESFSPQMLQALAECRDEFEAYTNNPSVLANYVEITKPKELVRFASQQETIKNALHILNNEYDASKAITGLLEELGIYYNADRAYIYEISEDRTAMSNTYEWCRNGIEPEIEKMQNIPYTDENAVTRDMMNNGICRIKSVENEIDHNSVMYKVYTSGGIFSLMAVPIRSGNIMTGGIGLTNPRTAIDDELVLTTLTSLIHGEIMNRTYAERKVKHVSMENHLLESVILSDSYSYFKVNLTQNVVIPPIMEKIDGIAVDYSSRVGTEKISYDQVIAYASEHFVAPSDRKNFEANFSREFLLECYAKGVKRPEYSVKVATPDEREFERKCAAFMAIDDSTGDVYALFAAYAIEEVQTNTSVLEGMSCLVVEDNDLMLDMAGEILFDSGVEVHTAVNGLEAVEYVSSGKNPDFILMDVTMPVMDGIEATRAIRELSAGADSRTMIIGMTASKTDTVGEEMISAGADACIPKPIDVNELSRILMSCMKKHSRRIEKELSDTIIIANTDALTGVKNTVAFTDKINELTLKMGDNPEMKFAIVMCDINNLKRENDTNGHSAGDKYIKNACSIICDVFTHSPVYRIGGDEFAVILEGRDFENANALLEQVRYRVEQAELLPDVDSGRASFASGIATFEPGKDASVSDVMKRADAEMYQHKKGGRG